MKLTMYVHKVYTSEDLKKVETMRAFIKNDFTLKDNFVLDEVISKHFNEMGIIVSLKDFGFLKSKVNQISDMEFELKLEFICNA